MASTASPSAPVLEAAKENADPESLVAGPASAKNNATVAPTPLDRAAEAQSEPPLPAPSVSATQPTPGPSFTRTLVVTYDIPVKNYTGNISGFLRTLKPDLDVEYRVPRDPKYGDFIVAVNGEREHGNWYWFIYVNDVSSEEGVDGRQVEAGNVISLRLKLTGPDSEH